ncbi:DUF6000 family protein [Amycolatopsis sp. NPDC051903]|uniref:DUF6000 family protein n=1 Tax=Amycolatopsis sp. NPDC051903 TaxID=3363936 RepID=UPI0037AD0F81
MRNHRHEPALGAFVERYVTPGRRYLRLGGGMFRFTAEEKAVFGRSLAEDALLITDDDLEMLFGYEWRAQRTAAWLAALPRRDVHRARLRELVLTGNGEHTGASYCFALARFGKEPDALILVEYLRTHRGGATSSFAMGALAHLDQLLGTDHGTQILDIDDQRWHRTQSAPGRQDFVDRIRAEIAARCTFADDCMALVEQPPFPER